MARAGTPASTGISGERYSVPALTRPSTCRRPSSMKLLSIGVMEMLAMNHRHCTRKRKSKVRAAYCGRLSLGRIGEAMRKLFLYHAASAGMLRMSIDTQVSDIGWRTIAFFWQLREARG